MKKFFNRNLTAVIAITSGILISANMYKVSATMSLLMGYFNLTAASAGWLISIVNVIGVILSIPAGRIMIKTGSKKMGVFAILCGLIGDLFGLWSYSLPILLCSRLIEGFSYALIAIVVPSIIADWFPPEKRGLPMAIWSCWIGLGLLLALKLANLSTVESIVSSWQTLWSIVAVLLAINLVLFQMFVPQPTIVTSANHFTQSPAKDTLLNPAAWCLSLIFLTFSAGVVSITTFTTTYCQDVLLLSLIEANNYASYLTYGMIAGGILIGIVLNHCNHHYFLLILSMVLTVFTFSLMFSYSISWAVLYMFIGGCVLSMIPAVIFTIAPHCALSPETTGVVMGILSVGQNLGGFCAIITGKILYFSSYATAAKLVTCLGFIGIFLCLLYVKRLSPSQ